jgi:hypothetical protein
VHSFVGGLSRATKKTKSKDAGFPDIAWIPD